MPIMHVYIDANSFHANTEKSRIKQCINHPQTIKCKLNSYHGITATEALFDTIKIKILIKS